MALRTILCPVDFTSPSEHGFDYAVTMAGNVEAELRILHVSWPIPVMMTHPAAMTPADGDVNRRREEESKDLLLQMETRARTGGVAVSTKIRSGDIHKELYSEIMSTSPDLVVMGTHARHGFDRWLYGSVTEETIRHCPVPILAVPESKDAPFPVPPNLGRILIATDSVHGLAPTFDRIRPLGKDTDIHVLHIVSDAEESKDALVGLSSVLDSMAAGPRFGFERKRLVPEVEIGIPDERILIAAERIRPDLIVVNPHDKKWLVRLFNGSTVEPVLREAPCPVMTVPEGLAGESRPGGSGRTGAKA